VTAKTHNVRKGFFVYLKIKVKS